MTKITSYYVPELDSKTYRYLYYLNFRGSSQMQQRLSQARKSKILGRVFIAEDEESNILGWCLAWKDPKHKYLLGYVVYFYVKKVERKKGVGTKLMKAVYDWYRVPLSVWMHDEISEEFFKSFDLPLVRYESE